MLQRYEKVLELCKEKSKKNLLVSAKKSTDGAIDYRRGLAPPSVFCRLFETSGKPRPDKTLSEH